MKKPLIQLFSLFLCFLSVFSLAPSAKAAQSDLDLSARMHNREFREYVEMMVDYHIRNNEMVKQTLEGGFSAVFLFDGCSDNLKDPELSDLSYYRVSGVCLVLRQGEDGKTKLVYFNNNCSTIPDRPLEYGAWSFPEVGDVGPATVCDGTYQLYSVRHKGAYEALHVRTEYYDGTLDAVYMVPEGYVSARANEINIHTRTSNHTSSRGMWSAGCPLVGGGQAWEFRRLMEMTYYQNYEEFELDNFVGVVTIDRMKLREELYTLYKNPNGVDMFLANSRKIQPQMYLRQCTDEQTVEKILPRKSAGEQLLMTLPCSNDHDARSREMATIPRNATMEVLGSIRNDQGSLWYQVRWKDMTGYIPMDVTRELSWLEWLDWYLFG